jgi:hypothetical protein
MAGAAGRPQKPVEELTGKGTHGLISLCPPPLASPPSAGTKAPETHRAPFCRPSLQKPQDAARGHVVPPSARIDNCGPDLWNFTNPFLIISHQMNIKTHSLKQDLLYVSADLWMPWMAWEGFKTEMNAVTRAFDLWRLIIPFTQGHN